MKVLILILLLFVTIPVVNVLAKEMPMTDKAIFSKVLRPVSRNLKVLLVGDSITATPEFKMTSVPYTKDAMNGKDTSFFLNTTDSYNYKFRIETDKPSAVFIHLGSNDVIHLSDMDNISWSNLIRSNLDQYISIALDHKVYPILSNVYIDPNYKVGISDKILLMNQIIKDEACKYRVGFFDYNKLVSSFSNPVPLVDGLHPNTVFNNYRSYYLNQLFRNL